MEPEAKIRDSLRARSTVDASERGYFVNEDGDVISPTGKKRKPQPYKNSAKKGGYYYRFTISIPGSRKRTTITFHQLAAYQKFGAMALAKGVLVRHLDGNSENNRPDNLVLGNESDNAMDQCPKIRKARAKHAASHLKRLNDIQVASLRRDRAAGATLKVLCAKYGIAKSTCSYIINRKTYA